MILSNNEKKDIDFLQSIRQKESYLGFESLFLDGNYLMGCDGRLLARKKLEKPIDISNFREPENPYGIYRLIFDKKNDYKIEQKKDVDQGRIMIPNFSSIINVSLDAKLLIDFSQGKEKIKDLKKYTKGICNNEKKLMLYSKNHHLFGATIDKGNNIKELELFRLPTLEQAEFFNNPLAFNLSYIDKVLKKTDAINFNIKKDAMVKSKKDVWDFYLMPRICEFVLVGDKLTRK